MPADSNPRLSEHIDTILRNWEAVNPVPTPEPRFTSLNDSTFDEDYLPPPPPRRAPRFIPNGGGHTPREWDIEEFTSYSGQQRISPRLNGNRVTSFSLEDAKAIQMALLTFLHRKGTSDRSSSS